MFWDSVFALNKSLLENINNLSWVLFLLLRGMQICVSEESLGFKFLPFLIIILGWDKFMTLGFGFQLDFNLIQPVSMKEKMTTTRAVNILTQTFA